MTQEAWKIPEDAKFKPIPLSKLGKKKASKTACHRCNCCRVYRVSMAVNLKNETQAAFRRGYRAGERAALGNRPNEGGR
jgi:hypothetical protein